MASIGEAFIDVHANTSPFHREVARDLDRVADDAEGELNKTGRSMGDKISDGVGIELKRRGKSFAKAIGDGTKNTVIRVRSIVRFDQIRDSIRRRFRRDVGDTIQKEIGDALDRSARSGVFSKISQGLADAIGAGFNVSGRSPLIAVLLPALAALVGVIVAALQAANALVAVLFIIPGLLASIGLQVGVLMIAFQGVGTAIQGAFAAKNAKELRLALKDLTPSARSFVRELLPLRDLFREIGRTVQERFFNQFAGVITAIRKALGPSLVSGFGDVAAVFGRFVRSFGELLASPGFVKFFNTLVPATVRWIDKFGQSLFGRRGFVTGLIAMATALMPFMEKFGDIILRNLDHISAFMFQLASSPATSQWLDDMATTLQLVFDLIFKVGEFLFVFLNRLNEAGGQNVITVLMEALSELMFVLASPVGLKAMEALVNLGIIGIRAFTGLVVIILGVLAALEVLSEWFRVTGGPFILDVLRAIGQAAVDMATFLGVWIERILRAIGGFFVWLWGVITTTKNNFSSLTSGAAATVSKVMAVIKGLPGQILGALKNLGGLLVGAGRSLVQGLIDGIRQKINELKGLVSYLASLIAGFFGSSPAEEGPLSGQGWTKIRGQHMIQDLIKGIQAEAPNLRQASMDATSNIVFGANSIQMKFTGPVPDQQQARTVGAAMGMSAAEQIAARNTRLVVRTL